MFRPTARCVALTIGLVFSCTLTPVLSSGSGILENVFCSLSELLANRECCLHARVDFKYRDFQMKLQKMFHGQSRAARHLANAINDHWNGKAMPQKALVMTLHGPTGIGKTFITKILADYTFAKGAKSQFYHFFSAKVHFPWKSEFDLYHQQLQSWIRGNVSYCEKSLFVFDEVERMPNSLLDVLKPFVDYNSVIGGVDFRRSIFVLLSNIGSEKIMKGMVEWKRHDRPRDDFKLDKQDRTLAEKVFSDEGGLKDSELLSRHLVSHFIPFLPLEREHVVKCIEDYLRSHSRGVWDHREKRDAIVKQVLGEIPFGPNGTEFFSTTGCKRVADKVNAAIVEMEYTDKIASEEL